MFITNGKSLFGNTGLIISLIILCVLLYMSYNKCYKEDYNNMIDENMIDENMIDETMINNKENFEIINPSISTNLISKPKDVRINIAKTTITVNFSIDNSSNTQIPQKFIIILAQYDSNKINTGNNQFILSNDFNGFEGNSF
jgi:hypothetical protein